MAFIIVQFWGPIPTITEVFMGDTLSGSLPSGDPANAPQGMQSNFSQSSGRDPYNENETRRGQHAHSGQSLRAGYTSMQTYSSQQQQHLQHARPEGFNMAALGIALPDLAYQTYGNAPSQRYPQGPNSPGLLYQLQNAPQYASDSPVNPSTAAYNVPYQGQYHWQGMYGTTNEGQHLSSAAPGCQFYNSQGFAGQQQQQGSPYLVQINQYGSQSPMYSGSPSQYGARGSFPSDSRHSGQQRGAEYLGVSQGGPTERPSSIGRWEGLYQPVKISCIRLR